MLICHCNVISEHEVKAVIRDLLEDDPWQIIVPAKVYRALDKKCKCSGCVPAVVDLIMRLTTDYQQELARSGAERPASGKSEGNEA